MLRPLGFKISPENEKTAEKAVLLFNGAINVFYNIYKHRNSIKKEKTDYFNVKLLLPIV